MSARRLEGRRIFLSGGSRGIGLAIARACAAEGADVAIAAKTAAPHPKLPGTVFTAADEIRDQGGGQALPIVCDIRDEHAVEHAVDEAAEAFGGLDVVINNASAIALAPTGETTMKRYDLMTEVNSRGTFAVTRFCLPHLLRSEAAHILTLSPPLDFSAEWFRDHTPYTFAKYGMSVLSAGWAAELEGRVAVNCLWPRTTIDTAAVRNLLGGANMAAASRTPAIVADAAVAILTRGTDFSGWFCLDDLVLAAEGVRDFDRYAASPGTPLQGDFFVPRSAPAPDAADGMVGWRAPTL